MRCNKCGAECKDNQAFCLNCGNPLQVVPDFNLIEAELAGKVEELLDEEKDEPKEELEELDINERPTKCFDEDLGMQLKMININNENRKNVNKPFYKENKAESDLLDFNAEGGETRSIDSDLIRKGADSNEIVAHPQPETEDEDDDYDDEPDYFESMDPALKKKMIKITLISVAAFIGVLILVFVIIYVLKNRDTESDYTKYYNAAVESLEKSDADSALISIDNAINKATTDEEEIKAREYKDTILQLIDDSDTERIENLKALIELDSTNASYYKKLASIYSETENYVALLKLVSSVTDEDILESLSEYLLESPTASVESGTYDTVLTIELSTDEEAYIYYILTKTENESPAVTKTDKVYTAALEITEDGTYYLYTVVINEDGLSSLVATYTYEVAISTLSAPDVSPASGKYTDYSTYITVTVPDGYTAYYVYGDDTETLSTESEVYTEPIQMKMGANNFKVFYVDADGRESGVTDKVYRLEPAQNHTIAEGKAAILEYSGFSEDDVTISWLENLTTEYYGYYIYEVTGINDMVMYYAYDYCADNGVFTVTVTQDADSGDFIYTVNEEEE